jgi:hypothetical protein
MQRGRPVRDENKTILFGKKLKQTPRFSRLIDRRKRGVFSRGKEEEHEKMENRIGGTSADGGMRAGRR